MDGYSEDEISSRESQQSSENEGEVHERSPISDEEPVIDEAGPSSSSFTINEHTNNNTTTSISKLQPFADTCKSYEIVPYVAAIHACHVHALDVTKNMRWVFTGGDDGFIRKYDFFASMSGKTLLTQNQKHTQVESVQKAGVIVSYWENEEQPPPTPKSEGTSQNISEPSSSEIKLSSVYSIAVQSEAIWLLSGLEPEQQRLVIRLLFMVPVYTISDLLAYFFIHKSVYFAFFRDTYQAWCIASFFNLLLEYLGDDGDYRITQIGTTKMPPPLCCIRFNPSKHKSFFLPSLKLAVLQYALILYLTTFISVVLQLIGVYCKENYSIYFPQLHLVIIQTISSLIANLSLLMLFESIRKELIGYQLGLKDLCINWALFIAI
ncbi:5183_t:CDS:2 [Entrophospora sp. SA101]|nr:5183_t:CDS:2 [Entrophospora sp. SA101]